MRRKSEFQELVIGHAVLFALIAVNLLVFTVELFLPPDSLRGFNCVPADVVAAWGQLSVGRFEVSDWRAFASLISYAFLHADLEHVLFNMIYLWIFGYLTSELLGQGWTLAIYVITAIGGGVCFVLFQGDSVIPMLGASGAVAGFQGAYLGLAVRYTLPSALVWPLARPVAPLALGFLAAFWFYLDFSGSINPGTSNTAFATHLGGFVSGLFLTSFVTPKPKALRD